MEIKQTVEIYMSQGESFAEQELDALGEWLTKVGQEHSKFIVKQNITDDGLSLIVIAGKL